MMSSNASRRASTSALVERGDHGRGNRLSKKTAPPFRAVPLTLLLLSREQRRLGQPVERCHHPISTELRNEAINLDVARGLRPMAELSMNELGRAAHEAGCLRHRWRGEGGLAVHQLGSRLGTNTRRLAVQQALEVAPGRADGGGACGVFRRA